MAWTTPKTWASAEIVTADMLNTYLRDNQTYIKERLDGTAKQYVRTATDYTTTSTSLVDVDASNMALTLTTDGSDVLVTFTAFATVGGVNDAIVMGVKVDSTDYELVGTEGPAASSEANPSFTYIFTGLSAASHTFTLRWRSPEGSTATLVAGTILFDVREMIGKVA